MEETARIPVPVVARACQAQKGHPAVVQLDQAFVFLRGSEPEFHLYDRSDQESSALSDSLGQ